jgi:basic amino acid/polyamine antiporter, APA family
VTASSPALARRLTLRDAVVIGLGSMIGAGVFAAFAPAARAAGSGLIIGLAIAGFAAFANATSSAQLAAQFPESGGTYAYGNRVLGQWWGFVAGWSFVIGKTASCAAMALVFASYVAPGAWQKPVAIAAVLSLGVINSRGVTKTARLTLILVILSGATLLVFLGAGSAGGLTIAEGWVSSGPYGVLQSAGLLFFAFAGYARVATLGEEVINPSRTIPRAIVIALGVTIVLYAAVAVVLLGVLGPERLANSSAPLAEAVTVAGSPALAPVMRIGAAVASLGALLGLIAGVGRTTLAMARRGDLPRWLAAVHPKFLVPYRAELTLSVLVSILVLVSDLRGAIAFSSFGVLLYYFVANVAALRQHREYRRYPRVLAVTGVVLCAVLVVTVPVVGSITGLAVLIAGVVGRIVVQRWASKNGAEEGT